MCAQGLWQELRNHHEGTVAALLASMDRAGIKQALLCPVATKASQVEKITDWAATLASDRIIPFGSIHPAYAEPEREIERAVALGLRGLKFHPQYMDCAVDDPACLRIARAAARARLPVAFHGGYHPAFERHDVASPLRIRRLHDAVPDLRIIACHMGGMDDWQAVIDYLVGTGVYLETSFVAPWCPPAILHAILARHDPRRIVFGTDSPWNDQGEALAVFKQLPLSAEALELALCRNAAELVSA